MKSILILIYITLFPISLFSIDVDPVGNNVKMGVKKFKTGDYPGSLENFRQAEKDLKDDSRIEYNKGSTYYKLNDYQSATKHFEKSLKTKDNKLKARSLYNLGNTNAKMGDKKEAIKKYLEALKYDPEFAPARKNIEILRKKEEDDKKQNKNNQDGENQGNQNQDNTVKNQNPNQNQNNFQNQNQKNLDEEQNSKMTKSEAERILESSRNDTIKRRKLKERRPEYDSMFW
ncbi:MAG: tetratricopeptide repeat protein [Leptospiraceae bacterium]|nr:tetratricopeptide repeat protein [Leptospiraceae bacterium]